MNTLMAFIGGWEIVLIMLVVGGLFIGGVIIAVCVQVAWKKQSRIPPILASGQVDPAKPK